MEHADPRLRELQRNVGYFYIVALAKRKQYALAADEAARWLATYNRRDELRSPEGLGVLIELAKNIDAQMPEFRRHERPKASAGSSTSVSQVVRFTLRTRKTPSPCSRNTSPARPSGPRRSRG